LPAFSIQPRGAPQGNASLLDWELWRNLVRGEIDFAVDIPSVEGPQLCHQSLMVDGYVCVLMHGHPVLRHALTLERSMALQHIHVSSRRYRRDDRSGAEYAAIPRGQI
jgi:DNA-binding transcriptional LysR family regulator